VGAWLVHVTACGPAALSAVLFIIVLLAAGDDAYPRLETSPVIELLGDVADLLATCLDSDIAGLCIVLGRPLCNATRIWGKFGIVYMLVAASCRACRLLGRQ